MFEDKNTHKKLNKYLVCHFKGKRVLGRFFPNTQFWPIYIICIKDICPLLFDPRNPDRNYIFIYSNDSSDWLLKCIHTDNETFKNPFCYYPHVVICMTSKMIYQPIVERNDREQERGREKERVRSIFVSPVISYPKRKKMESCV